MGINREQVIDDLNAILSLEFSAVLQYTYQAFVVHGLDYQRFQALFQGEAAESLGHAKLAGDKIVALGGVPSTETRPINPTTDLRAMLEYDLSLEREAVASYTHALDHAGDDVALRSYLENQVEVEQRSVEEFERLLQ